MLWLELKLLGYFNLKCAFTRLITIRKRLTITVRHFQPVLLCHRLILLIFVTLNCCCFHIIWALWPFSSGTEYYHERLLTNDVYLNINQQGNG
jgi:hypothetical protein